MKSHCFALLLATTAVLAPDSTAAAPPTAEPAPIQNGVPTSDFPAVGLLTYPKVECTVTLIGCRTILTAGHCACYDSSLDPPRSFNGQDCGGRPELLSTEGKHVFFPNAGFFGVESIALDPLWGVEPGHDLSVWRLDRPVEGILPRAVSAHTAPAPGTAARLVGFGRTDRDSENQAIKRTGTTEIAGGCSPYLCTQIEEPLEPAGAESGLCFNDSGSPLLVDFGTGPVVAGVASSISNGTCMAPNLSRFIDVAVDHDWIVEAAGDDLGTAMCGDFPLLGADPAARAASAHGTLSAADPEARFSIQVAADTDVLRIALNGEGVVVPATHDFDLFAAPGGPLDPDAATGEPFCAPRTPESVESCEITAPVPGPWSILVRRARGEGEFQVVSTQYSSVPSEPSPDEYLTSADLPGFEIAARFGASGETAGEQVADCVAETLCVSGALADRPELFVKVIGPRPNGYLWVQVSRFTPSRVEIWIRQTSTGAVRHYVLDAALPASDDVPGLQDRQAFVE